MKRTGLTYLLIASIAMISCGKAGEEIHEPTQRKGAPTDAFKNAYHAALLEKTIGHFDKAIPLFLQCLQLEPKSDAVHFALSDLYERTGEKIKSIEYAEQAYQLDTDNKWYVLRLADLYFSENNFQKSANYFELAIENAKSLDLKYKYTEALIKSNQKQKAIDMLNEIEIEVGVSPELSITKHELLFEMAEVEASFQELEKLLDYDPYSVENRVIVADYYMRANQPSRAEQIADETIKEFPNSGEAHILMADMNLRKNNIDEAFEFLQTGFEKEDLALDRKLDLLWGLIPFAFNPSNPAAERAQTEMITLFEKIYDEKAKNDKLHNHYGFFLQNMGDNRKAREQYKIVCEINPSSFESWNKLLTLEYDLGMHQELFEDGQASIDLFPSQPLLYLLTGIGAYETDRFQEAEEWLFLGKDLVVKDPTMVSEFYYHLGKNSGLQGHQADADGYFEQALEENPKNSMVYYVQTLQLLEDDKLDAAEEKIKGALTDNPDDAFLLDVYGLVLIAKKEYKAAQEVLEEALMPDVFNSLILEHYGDALYLGGEPDKAVEIWENAKKYGGDSELLDRKIADKKYYEN